MTLLDIAKLIQEHWGSIVWICVGMSGIVEVSKIKINPWSKLFECFSNILMKSIKQELDSMNVKIDELKEKSEKTATVIDDNEVWRLRHEILSFANSCKNKKRHTKDEFEHILEAHDRYNDIIKKRGIPNGVMDVEHAYIRDLYRHCLEENSFLQ